MQSPIITIVRVAMLAANSVSADERLPDVVTLIKNVAPVAVDCITLPAAAPKAFDTLDAVTPMYGDAFPIERLLDGVSHAQHVASAFIENAAPMPVDLIKVEILIPMPYDKGWPNWTFLEGMGIFESTCDCAGHRCRSTSP